MIVEERMEVFLNSFDTGNSPFLNQLEEEAHKDRVPIIRPGMQSLLRTLLAAQKPARILEVGTAIGFSAILMAEYTEPSCQITTIENYEKRIPQARLHFQQSGYEDRITLLEGDAAEILPGLQPYYDLIFMDAAKGQYITFLPDVLRLLAPGGLLISDNVLQEGDLLESHFAVERRNRTIYRRMRQYLHALTHTAGLETTILPVGDGVSLTVKKSKETSYEKG